MWLQGQTLHPISHTSTVAARVPSHQLPKQESPRPGKISPSNTAYPSLCQSPAASPYTQLGYPIVLGDPVPLGPVCPQALLGRTGCRWECSWRGDGLCTQQQGTVTVSCGQNQCTMPQLCTGRSCVTSKTNSLSSNQGLHGI